MDRAARRLVLAMMASGLGGAMTALLYCWVHDLPLWQPGRLGVISVVSAGVALLVERSMGSDHS
jgi:hypothetical protein